jgi:hypothetical protein
MYINHASDFFPFCFLPFFPLFLLLLFAQFLCYFRAGNFDDGGWWWRWGLLSPLCLLHHPVHQLLKFISIAKVRLPFLNHLKILILKINVNNIKLLLDIILVLRLDRINCPEITHTTFLIINVHKLNEYIYIFSQFNTYL